jgi:hypothetical protein
MKQSTPHKDEIQWLVSVYCSVEDEELKDEAYGQLIAFGFNDLQIQKLCQLQGADHGEQAFEKAWKVQQERNREVSYSFWEKIGVFLLGPWKLIRFRSDLIDLWQSNYKLMFRQHLVLLIAGILFWLGFVRGCMEIEYNRQVREIEKVDISEWEKSRQEGELIHE